MCMQWLPVPGSCHQYSSVIPPHLLLLRPHFCLSGVNIEQCESPESAKRLQQQPDERVGERECESEREKEREEW